MKRILGSLVLIVVVVVVVVAVAYWWNPPMNWDFSVSRFRVEIVNEESRPWPPPVIVYLNGKPPAGCIYRHQQPIAPGERISIPLAKFERNGELIDPSKVEPFLVQIVVEGRESVPAAAGPQR